MVLLYRSSAFGDLTFWSMMVPDTVLRCHEGGGAILSPKLPRTFFFTGLPVGAVGDVDARRLFGGPSRPSAAPSLRVVEALDLLMAFL